MNTKINLQQLARKVAMKKRTSQRSAEAFLREFFDAIKQNVTADKSVKITGLGTFKIIEVLERESVNVNTGERITIPGHTKLSFTPEGSLKEMVNKPFADFQTVVINDSTSLEEMERIPSDVAIQEAFSPESEEEVEDVENAFEIEQAPESEPEEMPELENEETTEPESEEIPKPQSEGTLEPQSEETLEAGSEEASEPESEETPEPENEETPEPVPVAAPVTQLASEPVSEKTSESNDVPLPPASQNVRAMTAAEKWALALGVILLCVMSYLWGYHNGYPSDTNVKVVEAETETEALPVEEEKEERVEDSSSLPIDTVSAVPVVEEEQVAPPEKAERSQEEAIRPTLVLGKKYQITGTRKKYVMKPGDYLTKIAQDEYGAREFAKYIIAHNHFSNPNNVPIGMEILLPELEEMK